MHTSFKRLALLAGVFVNLCVLHAQNKEFVILHTNDTHSQIEPNPASASRNADEGGVVRRAAAIEEIRAENKNVLLFDAGDFVQGTPYYNFFKGEVEIQVMNRLGYQAATLGNHEFDNGMEDLAKLLAMAQFPLVCANYDVTGTILEQYVKKTTIIEKDGVRFGIIGLSVDPDGLISKNNIAGVKFLNPSETANACAAELKKQGCDIVIVLSHLGYFKNDTSGDRLVAKESTDIDMIIGGHTHTPLKGCVEVVNKAGKPVRNPQTGGRGLTQGGGNLEYQ